MIDGKATARSDRLDTRLSNTATHADHFISPIPGSEAAILWRCQLPDPEQLYNASLARWWNWREYLKESQTSNVESPKSEEEGGRDAAVPGNSFEHFEGLLKNLYDEYTFEFAAGSGCRRLGN